MVATRISVFKVSDFWQVCFMLQILYEDNHLIAINKQSGDLVQGDVTGDEPLSEKVKAYIKKKYNKPGEVFLGVVHRLDRPVSGVVVFARTSKALDRMNALFRERETQKIYWALVDDKPPKAGGKLIHWLIKNEQTNKVSYYDRETPNALQSELNYRILQERSGLFLLEVLPITGRSHQIRVQLSAIGCPILGDVKYGSGKELGKYICLHASRLVFTHPIKKVDLEIKAPTPSSEFWNQFPRS
jgi:23S rRNA pseudouridine1911/1915/1917 synthase